MTERGIINVIAGFIGMITIGVFIYTQIYTVLVFFVLVGLLIWASYKISKEKSQSFESVSRQ